jgi:hypothetical protein
MRGALSLRGFALHTDRAPDHILTQLADPATLFGASVSLESLFVSAAQCATVPAIAALLQAPLACSLRELTLRPVAVRDHADAVSLLHALSSCTALEKLVLSFELSLDLLDSGTVAATSPPPSRFHDPLDVQAAMAARRAAAHRVQDAVVAAVRAMPHLRVLVTAGLGSDACALSAAALCRALAAAAPPLHTLALHSVGSSLTGDDLCAVVAACAPTLEVLRLAQCEAAPLSTRAIETVVARARRLSELGLTRGAEPLEAPRLLRAAGVRLVAMMSGGKAVLPAWWWEC